MSENLEGEKNLFGTKNGGQRAQSREIGYPREDKVAKNLTKKSEGGPNKQKKFTFVGGKLPVKNIRRLLHWFVGFLGIGFFISNRRLDTSALSELETRY